MSIADDTNHLIRPIKTEFVKQRIAMGKEQLDEALVNDPRIPFRHRILFRKRTAGQQPDAKSLEILWRHCMKRCVQIIAFGRPPADMRDRRFQARAFHQAESGERRGADTW